MSIVGSVIANRGIRLYVSCRAPAPKVEAPEQKAVPAPEEQVRIG
jgi:hypothetical protein